MDLANVINRLKVLDLEQLSERLGFRDTLSLEAALPQATRYRIWFGTAAYTKFVYKEMFECCLNDGILYNTYDLIGVFSCIFLAHSQNFDEMLVISGRISAAHVSSMLYENVSASTCICPAYPFSSIVPLNKTRDAVFFSSLESWREIGTSRRMGAGLIFLGSDNTRDREVVAYLAGRVNKGAPIVLCGPKAKVFENIHALPQGTTQIWAVSELGLEGEDYAIVWLEVKNPEHCFVHRPVNATTKTTITPHAATPVPTEDIRFVPRHEVGRLSERTYSLANERRVAVRSPRFLLGSEDLPSRWTAQFACQLDAWMDPKFVDCPALEAYAFRNLRSIGVGPLLTADNMLFESSLHVMDKEAFVYWSMVHRSDFIYDSDGSIHSASARSVEYTVDEEVMILSNPGFPMHYHFLFDLLPRLIFRKKELGRVKVAIPDTVAPYQLKALHENFCVPPEELIIYPAHGACTMFRNAVVTPTLVSDYWAMPECVEVARSAVQAVASRELHVKRVYVTRRKAKDRRALLNERALVERLTGLGFVEVDPGDLSFNDEVNLFANAEIVVGPFGSGMSNIVFCSPKTKIVILQPDSTNWRILSFIMEYLDLTYGYVFGDSLFNAGRGHNTDWLVDVDQVEQAIRDMMWS